MSFTDQGKQYHVMNKKDGNRLLGEESAGTNRGHREDWTCPLACISQVRDCPRNFDSTR